MSATVTWLDAYSVDNEEIDTQHKKFIEIFNRLYEGSDETENMNTTTRNG